MATKLEQFNLTCNAEEAGAIAGTENVTNDLSIHRRDHPAVAKPSMGTNRLEAEAHRHAAYWLARQYPDLAATYAAEYVRAYRNGERQGQNA